MTQFEQQAFGMSEKEVERQYMQSTTAKFSGLEMVVAGILSDCQEMLPVDEDGVMSASDDMIRKQLNIAKHILFEMQEKREAELERGFSETILKEAA